MKSNYRLVLLLAWLPAVAAGQVYFNKEPLAANAYAPLPVGSVRPEGWLRRQLEIQANGLTGHLDEFWPDLGPDSGWLGGASESWERGPYYVDGLVPLAYLLDDKRLIAKARKWVDWTLDHQRPDGGIGPDPGKGKYAQSFQATDWWPNMIMLKALTQYYEATKDARVIPVMTRYFRYHLQNARERPLVRWAAYRWADEVLSIVWLYNRTGDKELLELARVLHDQGYDWKSHFSAFQQKTKVTRKEANLSTHGVNNAMALKTLPVWWEISRDASDRDSVYQALSNLDRYHGQATGMFGADEHYAGSDPSQGTELCAVVEEMFSLEEVIGLFGDAALGDRLERITYNALPATFKPDMWAHQYDQQVNQIACTRLKTRNWTTNGPDANLFGLEPNFGCCTANMHQGWPKFVSHLWMATRNGGLAAVAYGPSRVEATVGGGVPVSIEEQTDYPFQGRIRLTVNPPSAVTFPLELRIPGWAGDTRITAAGQRVEGTRPGTLHTINRRWKRGDVVEIVFPMGVRTERHYRNSVALLRGPLLFSLKVGEDWRKVKGEEPHADWEVYPTTPWNYGLDIDVSKPAASVKVLESAVGAVPFSPEGAPVKLAAKARRVPEWREENGSASPVPESPVTSRQPQETITLVPYGSAQLRITLFPELKSE